MKIYGVEVNAFAKVKVGVSGSSPLCSKAHIFKVLSPEWRWKTMKNYSKNPQKISRHHM
jgi:hypothetical protein